MATKSDKRNDQAIELAYGENRCQSPAFLVPDEGSKDPLAMHRFDTRSGKASFITMADGSQILEVLCLLARASRIYGRHPYIAIAGKHGNPCGAAISIESPLDAIRRALMGDPVAVMGGEVITNFPIGDAEGEELFAPQAENDQFFPAEIGRSNWGLDAIFAPRFSKVTIKLLGERERRRMLENPHLKTPVLSPEETERRPVRGGHLSQKRSRFILGEETIINFDALFKEYKGQFHSWPNFHSLLVAWAVCWRASSNTVALAKDGMLIGLGCGQQDRIACVRLCLDRAARAGHDPKGSVFASDAFFPYAQNEGGGAAKLRKEINRLKMIARKGMELNEIFRLIGPTLNRISALDRREGPQLLVDAGCVAGVVPYDGKNKVEVARFFLEAGVQVAFVAPENRGFSKH